MGMVAERGGRRGLSKRERMLRARRRKRFTDDANEHADAPGSLLADPDFFMMRACGWDVARREFRQPEPPTQQRCRPDDRTGLLVSYVRPNPHHNPAKPPILSTDTAAWRWWKALSKDDQDDLYDLSLPSHGYADGESEPSQELKNPRFIEIEDQRSALEWGR
jgi:hypothetical protein